MSFVPIENQGIQMASSGQDMQVPGDQEALQREGNPVQAENTENTETFSCSGFNGCPLGHPLCQGLQSQQLQSMQFPSLVSVRAGDEMDGHQ